MFSYLLSTLIFIIYLTIKFLISDNQHIRLEKYNNENIPFKGSQFSAGWDIFSTESKTILSGKRSLISTGLFLKSLPDSLYLRVAPRSSLACKGIDIGAGVVDSDYRGEIKVLVINNSDNEFTIENNMRIAQLIPEKISLIDLYVIQRDTDILTKCSYQDSIRGMGGFGSSN